MTTTLGTAHAEGPPAPPADLADAAIGVGAEQLARHEAVIDRFLRGEYFSIDEEGKTASWNECAERRFGWAATEVIGEDFFERVAPGWGDELRPVAAGEPRDPAGAVVELETRRRDGATLTTSAAVVPIRVGDGYRLNKVLQDIVTRRGNPVEITRMKKRHADVLRLMVAALDGGELPPSLSDDDDQGWSRRNDSVEDRLRPAGALVVFDGSEPEVASTDADADEADAAESTDELGRLRVENRELRAQLRDAEREAEGLRGELEDFRVRGLAGGRGRQMREEAGEAVDPEEVERALRDDAFVLHAQPVLDLAAGAVTQHELLLRMIGADGGLLLPRAFLGVAREARLTGALDAWVVRRAIATIAEQAQVGRDVRLEVNLSAEALHDYALLEAIERDLATTGIDPARLVLEIPERVAIADPEGARTLARDLRALGCGFALDDFGTSFGSFHFLKDLPVDYLKIDGDLIVSLAESRTAQLVVKALVDVARGTGAETIAVFASDQQTLDLLRELGVDFAQGHKVGRPRPLADALSAAETPALRPVEAAPQLAETRNLAK